MRIKYFIRLLVATGLLFGFVTIDHPVPKQNTKPNVIIILIDDAGYADFGFMGSKDLLTPNIDALANDGIIFTDGHVSASVCSPSRAGLLTGRYQQRFGYECNEGQAFTGMDTTEVTMAQVMKANGYSTAAFGKWHVGYEAKQRPNAKGFDFFYGFVSGGRSYFYQPARDDRKDDKRGMMENGKQVSFTGYLTDVLADKTSNYIKEKKDKPFFIYWAPNAVHTPLEADLEDLKKFESHPRKMLAAMTTALDRGVGKIIATLKATGQYENTLIFFFSDNGGAANNQSINFPLKGFKGNEFEAGHRVPFFVSWPAKLKGGAKFDGLSSTLDVFPTVISATNSQNALTKPLDGINLLPFLTGEKPGNPHTFLFWRKDAEAAARYNNYKMIRVKQFGYRLYDLQNDLGERNDLQTTQIDVFNKMKREMEQWEQGTMAPLWTEGEEWDTITFMIHEDLMKNEKVRVSSPEELRKFNAQKK